MKVNVKKIKFGKNSIWLMLDAVMLLLILVNLLWMVFDFVFTAQFVQKFIQSFSNDFYVYYRDVIHPDFLFYDFWFVLIFLTEFVFRWIIAIYKKQYASWVSFPFVFWYDLIGCIPLASFRFLRLFRIATLMIRLQKRGVIDFTNTWWYKLGFRNYNRVLEEISDRVSSNILTGIQKEMKYGDETNKRIINEVILPRQEEFTIWIASRMKFAIGETYDLHKTELKDYLDKAIYKAVRENEDIARLELIPLFGKQISKALSSSVSDISYSLIDSVMKDLADQQMHTLMNKVVDISIKTALYESDNERIEQISKEIVIETLEVVKSQVNKKHYDK